MQSRNRRNPGATDQNRQDINPNNPGKQAEQSQRALPLRAAAQLCRETPACIVKASEQLSPLGPPSLVLEIRGSTSHLHFVCNVISATQRPNRKDEDVLAGKFLHKLHYSSPSKYGTVSMTLPNGHCSGIIPSPTGCTTNEVRFYEGEQMKFADITKIQTFV